MARLWLGCGVVFCSLVSTSTAAAQVPEDERVVARGDANGDGTVNSADGARITSYLYSGGPAPPCMNQADVKSLRLRRLKVPGANPLVQPKESGSTPTAGRLEATHLPALAYTPAMRQPTSIALLALLSLARPALAADSWPELRGPTGQGRTDAKDLPLTWSPTRNVAWKVPVPGKGWSSPSVAAGRIVLTSAVEEPDRGRLSLRALAFDAASGKPLWDVELFSHERSSLPPIHSKNSHASPTPLIEGERIYVHFGHLGTACLDLDGKPVWQSGEIKYPPVHGSGGSPIVVDRALIFSCDGASDPFVIALDKTTGKTLWKTPRRTEAAKKFSFSTPLLITVAGERQVISPGSDVVCAFAPDSGRELWRASYDGFSVIPRPVLAGGLLFLSTGYEKPQVLAIRTGGSGDVTATHIAWTLTRGAPNTPCMVAVGGELYLLSDSGVASCVDAATGKTHWQKRIGGTCSASLLAAEGRIYAIDEDGHGVVFKPGLAYEQLAENELGERTLASLAAVDGALFCRTERHLWRLADAPGTGPARP